MAKNYFEHEIQVKYVDNILSKNTDWDWFINYVEENFDIDLTINDSQEFTKKFVEIKTVLEHISKIHEFIDVLNVHKKWLEEIDQLALFHVGKIDLDKLNLKNDFMRLLALYMLSAKIINEKSDVKYFVYMDIFNSYNMFEIIDTTDFSNERDIIFGLINQLNIDYHKEKDIFKDNLKHIFHYCKNISSQLLEISNSPNAFSFFNSRNSNITNTWEERYLWELLCLEFKNGKFTPHIQYRDGSTSPDFSVYTPKVLSALKNYYAGTNIVYLVESIEYALIGSTPSQQTIDKHFELLQDNVSCYDEEKGFLYLQCSSLEFVLSFFEDERINTADKIADFNKSISKVDNIQYLAYLQKRKAPISKSIVRKIKESKGKRAKQIDCISDPIALNTYMNDEEIVSILDKDIFYKVSDKFEEVLEMIDEKDNVFISSLFLSYLLLLIKIKNNRNIIQSEVSSEIIYIRSLWQEKYYDICRKSLHYFRSSLKISDTDIKSHNLNIINKPLFCACSCLSIQEDTLIEKMEHISERPWMVLTKNISIQEDFPMIKNLYIDDRHPIDMIIKNEIQRIYDNNTYRFINALSIEKYIAGFYENIKNQINIYFSLFRDTQKLYTKVCINNSTYRFIEYSEKPALAHLTQLFPIIETKIRKLGEIYGISPICEKVDKYYKLKEPYSVLYKIIDFIYSETNQLIYAADFIFIHFALFAENGLNIRNECIHGNGFNVSDDEIKHAFKITLFCLNLLDYRKELILGDSNG